RITIAAESFYGELAARQEISARDTASGITVRIAPVPGYADGDSIAISVAVPEDTVRIAANIPVQRLLPPPPNLLRRSIPLWLILLAAAALIAAMKFLRR
ncbi:MAG: hypothetical protein LBS03_01515, partial [Bacteroidales bacterium]|nr:hypothetical protein [Bacteroidales bacterium]